MRFGFKSQYLFSVALYNIHQLYKVHLKFSINWWISHKQRGLKRRPNACAVSGKKRRNVAWSAGNQSIIVCSRQLNGICLQTQVLFLMNKDTNTVLIIPNFSDIYREGNRRLFNNIRRTRSMLFIVTFLDGRPERCSSSTFSLLSTFPITCKLVVHAFFAH